MNVLLIVLLFLLVFGILGIQLFKGMLGDCNYKECIMMDHPDPNMFDRDQQRVQVCKERLVKNRVECLAMGSFMEDVKDEYGKVIAQKKIQTEWEVPFNNYDNIFVSMMTFFEISTLEMWPGMMYNAIDSTKLDDVPIKENKPFISMVYIIYIFFTTFFIMNLFISVIVDKFNEEIKKRQGADNFTDEQKEWVKIQRLLVHTNPKIIPVEPINCFRLQCFKIV